MSDQTPIWTLLGGGVGVGAILTAIGNFASKRMRGTTPYDELATRITDLEKGATTAATAQATSDRHIRILASGFDVVWRDRQRMKDGGDITLRLSAHDEKTIEMARQLVTYGTEEPNGS